MTADLETLVIAAYLFADELRSPRPLGRPPDVSDEELIALAVAQAATGICSDRQFLGLVERLLPGFFPHLPDQSQYNRRLRALTPKLAWTQQRLCELLATGNLRVADGTLLGVANYAGCAGKSEFAGLAAYGYCPPKSRFYWGLRLVLLVDRRGLQGVVIRTPERARTAENAQSERGLARLRLVVESTIANLKCQMRLEQHLAKTPAGLVQRIAQRLLALTLGMLLNALVGRPPRSLVACDGR